jgi:hypothetical protein
MKPGYLAAYQHDDQWLKGEIIAIYASGMVLMDPGATDRVRHCISIENLYPPF